MLIGPLRGVQGFPLSIIVGIVVSCRREVVGSLSVSSVLARSSGGLIRHCEEVILKEKGSRGEALYSGNGDLDEFLLA